MAILAERCWDSLTILNEEVVMVFRRTLTMGQKEILAGYAFLLPWIFGFVFITGGPIIASLLMSFTQYEIVTAPQFVGLSNFQEMFGRDRLFWQSLRVTALYTLTAVPLTMVVALLLASLLNYKLRAMNFFRTAFYLPSILSGVAVAMLWTWVFNPDFGIINYLLGQIGIRGPMWLGSAQWVIPSFVIMNIWESVGGPMIIFLAGLQGIPTQLYEAAEIDGANAFTRFYRITLPMLSPTILFNLVMGVIGSWQVFTPAYVITQGGPNYASLFYVFYLYRHAFINFRMGYASAMAWFFFAVILVCTLAVLRSSSVWVYYEGERR